MPHHNPIVLKLEKERVHLLFRQNIPGAFAVFIYALAFRYVNGDLKSSFFESLWMVVTLLLGVMRIGITWLWKRNQHKVETLEDLKFWVLTLQIIVGLSGLAFGVAAWIGTQYGNLFQQIFTAINIIFMVAGAMACWCVSPRILFTLIAVMYLPWGVGLLASDQMVIQLLGGLSLVYLTLGVRVALSLSHFVDSSFRLRTENAFLTHDLKKQIQEGDQAREALYLSLSASDAMGWRWDILSDQFTCKGNLKYVMDLETEYFTGSLEDFLTFLEPSDRGRFRSQLIDTARAGGVLDTELGMQRKDGSRHELALRGKVYSNAQGQVTHLTGIAWDTSFKKNQTRLQQERDIHEAANKAKSIFLANASHEFRTPLAAIMGYVENILQNLKESHQDPLQLREDLVKISRNGKYLTTLVSDLLDLSNIDSEKFYFEKTQMSLKSEINESVLMVKALPESQGLALEVYYASELPLAIESDPVRFRQILVNLLTNAVRLTQRGRVELHVSHAVDAEKQGRLNLRVKDKGAVIHQELKEEIFEPFGRINLPMLRNFAGPGLGLALSYKLASLLGGSLSIVRTSVEAADEIELSINTGPVEKLQFPRKASTKPPSLTLKDIKILVADDAEDLRVLMRRYLEKQGALIDTCTNGEESIGLALTGNYDVILMDMKMPIMDGYEATMTLRQKGYKKPIVAVTAHASSDDRQRTLEAGCNDYLSKPVDLNSLVNTIKRQLLQPLDTEKPEYGKIREEV